MFGGASGGFSATAQTNLNTGALANGMAVSRSSQSNGNAPSLQYTPWVFLALALAYIVWAMIEQGQRVQETVEPANVAFNLRNIFMLTFTAILGIVGLKILFTKMVAFGVPGAATVNQIIAAS